MLTDNAIGAWCAFAIILWLAMVAFQFVRWSSYRTGLMCWLNKTFPMRETRDGLRVDMLRASGLTLKRARSVAAQSKDNQ